jgi:hypothetical protein
MVAGAALAATGVGAPMAALMVGGGATIATGSLKKGLMAGMGAFGGAGLAGGLMGAGAAGAAGSGAASAGLSALDAGMGLMPTGTIGAAEALIPSALDAGMGAMPTGNIGASALDAGMGAYPNASLAATPIAPPVNPTQPLPSPVATVTQAPPTFSSRLSQMGQGFTNLSEESGRTAFMDKIGGGKGLLKYGLAGFAPVLSDMMTPEAKEAQQRPVEATPRYAYDPGRIADPYSQRTGAYTGERTYFDPRFTRIAAGGGLMDIGPIEAMSERNQAETLMANQGQMFAEGGETKAVKPVEQDPYYTMSGQSGDAFKYLMGQMPAPSRAPAPAAVAPVQAAAPTTSGALGAVQSMMGAGSSNATMRPYTFDPATGTFTAMPVIEPMAEVAAPTTGITVNPQDVFYGAANGGLMSLAQGGVSHLGDYSDGGRLLKGPGDGVSDSIPASIGDKRPARLADGEFVVPARIVSELGNGSTEAGARKLYAMMDRVQSARKKSIGKNRVAVNSRAEKLLPV